MISRRIVLNLALLFAAPLPLALAQTAPKVLEPWARPTVQGQAGGGGFLKIVGGAAPDRLLSASADVAASVELHTMTMDGDVMRMRQVSDINVPAGKTVELKPGGLHIMLIGLKAPLANGSSFPLKLKFEKGGDVVVDMKVMSRPAAADPHAGHKH